MRDIPGLSQATLDQARNLALRAKSGAEAAPVVTPRATLPEPTISDGVATMRLYDYIDPEGGPWGISAIEFTEALDALPDDVTQIDLHVNSGGGSVWDGLTILNSLRQHPAKVTAIVDGIAASAASFIAVACDETVMMPDSRLMIHDAMGICVGQAKDMHDYADFLDMSSDGLAAIYATKAGGTTEEWRETMRAKGLIGQWYSAQEATDVGLVDSVREIATPAARMVVEAIRAAEKATTPTPPEQVDERTSRFMQRRLAQRNRGSAA